MGRLNASYTGIGEMLKSPEMLAAMQTLARNGQAFAVADAATYVDTGHYSSSFESSAEVKGDRAHGILRNTDDAALQIEYGTSDTPVRRTLRRAMDSMK